MKTTQTVCDVCGIPKKVTNHWLYAYVSEPSREVGGEFSAFSVTRKPILEARDQPKDICGQECATKLLQFWMATGSIDSPATKEPVSA